MNSLTKYTTIVSAGMLSCALIGMAQDASNSPPAAKPPAHKATPGEHVGYMETPRYAQKLQGTMTENSIHVFADKDFGGMQAALNNVTQTNQAGTLNEYPEKFDNDASSLKWNLAPGVLVILFNDASGKGDQLALWGKGQIPDLAKTDFNDKASRWAWYDVGGGAEPRSEGATHMPYGSQAIEGTLSNNSVQLWDDQKFQKNQESIAGVTSQSPGDWHAMPGKMENAVSSMRWNLPKGVVLIISAKDDGNKDIVIFGQGQYDDLGKINFDNSASRWAWAYIGAPTMDSKHNDKPNDR